MFVASQKRKENIAEYLLYMWQIEDLIRANNLDIDNSKDITNLGFYFVEYLEPTPFYIDSQYNRMDLPESTDNIKFKCYNSGYAKYSLKNKG